MSVLNPKPNTTIAFTDGACKGNPGPGGWGAFLVLSDGNHIEYFGGEKHTTNNQMELMGAIMALEKSPSKDSVEIWTDSSYVKNGITSWIHGWKKKGWKTASNKPVKNQELWQRLDALQTTRDVNWHWVKGHAGHEGNEKADELANKGILVSSDNLNGSETASDTLKKKLNNSAHSDLTQSLHNQPDRSIMSQHSESSAALHHNIDEQGDTTKSANMNPALSSADDDWLFTDPLGLNDIEMEDDISFSENQYFEHTDNLLDDTASKIKDLNMNDTNPVTQLTDSLNSSNSSTDSAELTLSHHPQNPIKGDDSVIEFDGDTSRANPHFKPLLPDPIHKGESGRQLIMDTETTGLDALKGDRIVEVGIVELVDRKFTGEKLHVYINPQRGMDEEVIRVHGISEAFLADKPTFDKVAHQLYDFMSGAEIIAHNASFDMTFLSMEFDKVGLKGFADNVVVTDSLALAKQQYPGQKNTLDALVRRLNVGKMDRTFHGALLDAEILAEVYLAMTGGQVSLAIDEEVQTENGSSHSDFSHLADKLIVAKNSISEHFKWVASLISDNPNLVTLQGIHYLTQITDDEDVNLNVQACNTQRNDAIKLANKLRTSLFIKS